MEIIHIVEMVKERLTGHISKIERCLNSDVFYFNGDFSYATVEYHFIRNLRKIKESNSDRKTLTIILTTNGGDANAVNYLVDQIRNHFNYEILNVIVPDWAFSAGTLFCFSANKIFMRTGSNLGPIDVQIMNQRGQFIPISAIMSDYQGLMNRHGKKSRKLNKYEQELISDSGLYNRKYIADLKHFQFNIGKMAFDYLMKYRFNYNGETEDGKMKIKELEKTVSGLCYPSSMKVKPIYSHSDRIYMHDLKKMGIDIIDYHHQTNVAFDIRDEIDSVDSLLKELMFLSKLNLATAGTNQNFLVTLHSENSSSVSGVENETKEERVNAMTAKSQNNH